VQPRSPQGRAALTRAHRRDVPAKAERIQAPCLVNRSSPVAFSRPHSAGGAGSAVPGPTLPRASPAVDLAVDLPGTWFGLLPWTARRGATDCSGSIVQCTESAVAEADRAPQRRRGGAPDPDGRHRGGRLESDGGGVVPRADGHRTTGQQAGKGLEELVPCAARGQRAADLPRGTPAPGPRRPDAQLQSAGGEVGEGGDLPAGRSSGRRDGRKTADPMVIVRVTAAAAARVRVLSSRRWSPAHSESRPARSAWRADPATSRERRTAPPRPAARPRPGPPQPPPHGRCHLVVPGCQADRGLPVTGIPSPACHAERRSSTKVRALPRPAARAAAPSPRHRRGGPRTTTPASGESVSGSVAQPRTVRSSERGCCPTALAGVASGVRTPRRQPWGRRR